MSGAPMTPDVLRFGGFAIDRRSGELLRGGRAVHLTPQAFHLLNLLVDRAGHVVTRDEIRKAVWGDGTFVDFDAAVNVCISQIRFALGDKATSPRFVETLPRRGYRFVAPVQAMPAQAPDDTMRQTTAVPATAGAPPPVPGETRRAGLAGVAVVVLLTAAGAGLALIAANASPRVPGAGRLAVHSVEALQKYERGRSGLPDAAPSELIDRVRHLTTAVTLEPSFAEAYVSMADAYLLIAAYRAQEPQLAYGAAKAAAAKALNLNPRLGEAHATYAAAILFFDWDWVGAGEHFRRALSLAPESSRVNHWYARYLTALGRHGQAREHAGRAHSAAPLSPSAETYAGVAGFYAGDFADATAHCSRAASLMPEFVPAQLCMDAAANPQALAAALPEVHMQPTLSAAAAGDSSRALDSLQAAANRHVDALIFLGSQRPLLSLASEPRFKNVRERVGIAAAIASLR